MARTNREVATRGLTVRFTDAASGAPPVLMVHSSGMSSRQWLRLTLELEGRGARPVAPDLLGYGESDAWPNPDDFPIDADVDAVLGVQSAIDAPCLLVGHSFGGFLALLAASARPDLTLGVVVHEPVSWGMMREAEPATVDEAFRDIDHDGLFFDTVRGGGEAWFERFVDFWSGKGTWAALPARQKSALSSSGRQTFLEVRALCLDETPAATYAKVRAPTVVTCGRTSPELERRVCGLVAGAIEGATLAPVEGGHMSPLTHADGFERVVFDMLERVGARRTSG